MSISYDSLGSALGSAPRWFKACSSQISKTYQKHIFEMNLPFGKYKYLYGLFDFLLGMWFFIKTIIFYFSEFVFVANIVESIIIFGVIPFVRYVYDGQMYWLILVLPFYNLGMHKVSKFTDNVIDGENNYKECMKVCLFVSGLYCERSSEDSLIPDDIWDVWSYLYNFIVYICIMICEMFLFVLLYLYFMEPNLLQLDFPSIIYTHLILSIWKPVASRINQDKDQSNCKPLCCSCHGFFKDYFWANSGIFIACLITYTILYNLRSLILVGFGTFFAPFIGVCALTRLYRKGTELKCGSTVMTLKAATKYYSLDTEDSEDGNNNSINKIGFDSIDIEGNS